jgi:hypothetical protein
LRIVKRGRGNRNRARFYKSVFAKLQSALIIEIIARECEIAQEWVGLE